MNDCINKLLKKYKRSWKKIPLLDNFEKETNMVKFYYGKYRLVADLSNFLSFEKNYETGYYETYMKFNEIFSTEYIDLFGNELEPQREMCILRADLVDYIEKSLLCNKPVLND